jgi:signal transduction histidine kinase
MDFNRLVEGVVEVTRRQNPEHVLTLMLDTSVPKVSCDQDKVSQLLLILLSNSTKYSPAGTEVVVSSRANADNVEVTVRDHGPGMPVDFDDTLLVGSQPGGASSADHLNRGFAAGLGLQIARQIVEMHSGRIWFENVDSQGCEFHFTLPLRVRTPREFEAITRK